MTTYQDIATQAKNRTDLTPTSYVTDAEWLDAINSSAALLYSLIANNAGDEYLVTETFMSGAAGADSLPLPSDFYKLISLEYAIGDGYYPVKRWELADNRFSRASDIPANVYRVWYIPMYTPATSLAQTFPVALTMQGWHEWVVLDICIKAHIKQETDHNPYMQQKAEIESRIVKQSANRNVGQPFELLAHTTTHEFHHDPYWRISVPGVRYKLHGNTIRLQPTRSWL